MILMPSDFMPILPDWQGMGPAVIFNCWEWSRLAPRGEECFLVGHLEAVQVFWILWVRSILGLASMPKRALLVPLLVQASMDCLEMPLVLLHQ